MHTCTYKISYCINCYKHESSRHMAIRKQYPLRIHPDIWNALEIWSRDEMRSVNGQIEWILCDSLKRAKRWPPHNRELDNSQITDEGTST